jgi:hypothetical protein
MKIEEDAISYNHIIDRLINFNCNLCSKTEILSIEAIIAKALNYDLLFVTPCDFIDRSTHYNNEELSLIYYVLKTIMIEYDIIVKWKSSILIRAFIVIIKKIPEIDTLVLQCIEDISKTLNNPSEKMVTYVINIVENIHDFFH